MKEDDIEDPVPFITKAHFEEAMSFARKSVPESEIKRYIEFQKKMKADALWPAMHGKIDLTPTPESVLAKLRKQKLRRKTEDEDGEGEPQPEAAAMMTTTTRIPRARWN